MAAVALGAPAAASAAVFTVTTNADTGAGSLRAAIEGANNNDNGEAPPITVDRIEFSGPLGAITPLTALPPIEEPVSINSTSTTSCQDTVANVQLDGNGAAFDGLVLDSGSDGSRICRLNVRAFNNGITISGDNVVIERSRIGTTPDGQGDAGNAFNGIRISGATSVDIGGAGDGQGNVISGNGSAGVLVTGLSTAARIAGNHIGVGTAGEQAIPNNDGVVVDPGSSATIGGGLAGERNVISGNTAEGVEGGNQVTVLGNYIGTDDEGDEATPNAVGIRTDGSMTIGSTLDPNLISGNAQHAIEVTVDGAVIRGNTIGPNAAGDDFFVGAQSDAIRLSGRAIIEDNRIAGHDHYGIEADAGSEGTTIFGNVIGELPNGAVVAGDTGINIWSALGTPGIQIGRAVPGEGNTIVGNSGSAIETAGPQTIVERNLLGLDGAGTASAANANENGVNVIDGAHGTRIGGPTLESRNFLGGNDRHGVQVDSNAQDVVVQNNWIGVGFDGVADRGNGRSDPGSGVALGGTATAQVLDNLIAHHPSDGVQVGTTARAMLLRNRIFDNGGATVGEIGIDLLPGGVTANNPLDGLQDFPVLDFTQTNGVTTEVEGTIETTPGATIRVDLFSSAACDKSGHGQGEEYLGFTAFDAGAGETAFAAAVAGTVVGRQITATATNLDTGETSEFSPCRAAAQGPPPPDDDGDGATPTPPTTGTPPTTTSSQPPPPPPPPKFPAKIRVLRNGVDDGVLDMLVEITQRAVTPGATLRIAYQSSGRTTRFDVPITGTQIKVRRRLPRSQPKATGITTVTYAGSSTVDAEEVRLRAADGRSRLTRTASSITNGVLNVRGTIDDDARGVVRLRLSYTKPDNSTGFLDYRATIEDGRWSLRQTLPADAARGGQLSIQFTGYERRNLRGEQTSKQVLG